MEQKVVAAEPALTRNSARICDRLRNLLLAITLSPTTEAQESPSKSFVQVFQAEGHLLPNRVAEALCEEFQKLVPEAVPNPASICAE